MQPRRVVHPLRDLKKQCQILGPEVQASLWPAEVEAAVLIQLTFRVFARVTPKMLARFINAHTAEPAFPPLPKARISGGSSPSAQQNEQSVAEGSTPTATTKPTVSSAAHATCSGCTVTKIVPCSC